MRSSLSHLLNSAHRRAGILWALAVAVWLVGTHLPAQQLEIGPVLTYDKLVHFIAYTVLGLLAGATLMGARRPSLRGAALAVGVLLVLAVVDEATQPLPWFNRSGELADWVADAAGAATGVMLYLLARRVGLVSQLVVGGRGAEVAQVD